MRALWLLLIPCVIAIVLVWQVARWRAAVRVVAACLEQLRTSQRLVELTTIRSAIARAFGLELDHVLVIPRESKVLRTHIGAAVALRGSQIDATTMQKFVVDVLARCTPNVRFTMAREVDVLQAPGRPGRGAAR